MRLYLKLLTLILTLGFAYTAHADDGGVTVTLSQRPHLPDDQYPTMMRMTLLGDAVLGSDGGQHTGAGGGIFVDFGHGWFSFEGGVQYLSTPVSVSMTNPNLGATGGQNPQNMVWAQYVGAALFAKYNYIESPGAVFSLKLGAMPAYLVNAGDLSASYYDQSTGGSTTMQPASDDVFGLAGFTATAPLTEKLAFVIDGTYYYGFSGVDANGTHSQGFLLGLGLRFPL